MVEISNQHSTYVLYKHLNASKRRRWAKIQDPGGNSDQIEPHPGFLEIVEKRMNLEEMKEKVSIVMKRIQEREMEKDEDREDRMDLDMGSHNQN